MQAACGKRFSLSNLQKPFTPYTKLLLASLPRLDAPLKLPLVANEGLTAEGGCVFAARCPHYRLSCLKKSRPKLLAKDGKRPATFFRIVITGLARVIIAVKEVINGKIIKGKNVAYYYTAENRIRQLTGFFIFACR